MTEANTRHLIERRRELGFAGLPCDEDTRLLAGGVKSDALRCVGDSKTKDSLIGMEALQFGEDGTSSLGELHYGEQDTAILLLAFLFYAGGDVVKNLLRKGLL